jgi:single-strand DNA-binding protein
MNQAILIGNLTRDPELSTTPSGVSVCRFSIAVNRQYKNADGQQETDFFTIVAWRGQADFCGKYLKKGRKVAVVGNIQNRSYDDKDGNKRYVTEIIANSVEFVGPKGDDDYAAEEGEPVSRPKKAKPVLEQIDDDDMPF